MNLQEGSVFISVRYASFGDYISGRNSSEVGVL